MRFIVGLIFILAFIYGLYLLFEPERQKSELHRVHGSHVRTDNEVVPYESKKQTEEDYQEKDQIAESNGYASNSDEKDSYTYARKSPDGEEYEEKEGEGSESSVKDHILSALRSYEEIFNAEQAPEKEGNIEYDAEKPEKVREIEMQSDIALSIYGDILGFTEHGSTTK
ncbi:MAG: hypothetical protein WBD99_02075 [Thermodesulfobacteriota bacterium]